MIEVHHHRGIVLSNREKKGLWTIIHVLWLFLLQVFHGWTPPPNSNDGKRGRSSDNTNNNTAKIVLYGHQVVFATSSAIEDATMFVDWKYQYHDRFQEDQFVVCETVEQLFGLISHASHVYTDRYHPSVAAHRLGIDFTVLRYPQEQSKLSGLYELVCGHHQDDDSAINTKKTKSVRRKKYSASVIRNELNANAFLELHRLLKAKVVEKTDGRL